MSCSGLEVYQQSSEFNSAVSNSSNNLLFLNIIRASKHYPMQFTKLQTYEGGGSTQGTAQFRFPFGPGAINPVYGFDPQFSVKGHLSKIALVDLNTQEAQSALKRQVTFNEYLYYMAMGGSRRRDIVETLLIESIELAPTILMQVAKRAKEECKTPSNSCLAYAAFRSECRTHNLGYEAAIYYADKVKSKGLGADNAEAEDGYKPAKSGEVTEADIKTHKVAVIQNSVESKCNYLAFRALIDMMNISGMNMYIAKPKAESGDGKKKIERSSKYADIHIENTNTSDAPKGSGDKIKYPVTFSDKKIMALLYSTECRGQEETGRTCVAINFRSPERVVRYLGEIVAAQTLLPEQKRFSPNLYVEDKSFEIFHVNRGDQSFSRHILHAVDEEGDRFSVPQFDHSDEGHDRTLESLALVADLINGAVSAKDLPQVTSISLSPQ